MISTGLEEHSATKHQPIELPARTVGIVIYPGVEIIDFTGPMEVFSFANAGALRAGLCQHPPYSLEVLAATPGTIMASCGLQVIATRSYLDYESGIDTLIIAGTPNVDCLLADPALQTWLKHIASRVRRLISVCTGAFLLAECGLLDGLSATTHWDFCERLAETYPKINVEPDRIFIKAGTIATSGGITSGIDLALALLEEDLGSELALLVARYLVMFLKRPGGQSQFSAYLVSEAVRPELKELQAWILVHLTEDLRVEQLAERMCMSPRHFARYFLQETGLTPAKFVELARIDAARHYLLSSQLPIETVADKTGFNDPERMRRAFIRKLGVNPKDYRERFGKNTYTIETVS